jgi:hypothetical protein
VLEITNLILVTKFVIKSTQFNAVEILTTSIINYAETMIVNVLYFHVFSYSFSYVVQHKHIYIYIYISYSFY